MKSDATRRERSPAQALGVMLTSVLAFSFGGIGCGVGEANHGAHDGSVDRSDAGTRTSADGGSVVDASAPDRASDAAHLDTSAGGSSVFDASAPDRTADVAANDGTDSGNADPCLSAADAGVSPGVGVALVADSQSGFSPTQHHCSWTYGYIAPGVDGGAPPDAVADGGPDGNSGGDAGASAGFTLMSDYDPNGGLWRVERNVYWTAVGPTVQHGNGIITSGGYTPVEQWSVRRWTSTVDGPITITGSLYKTLVGDAGNGIDARIVVDGTIVYAQFIGPNDSIGVHFFVPANVMVGSAVDFVLDPHLKNDVEDWTAFIAQIWQ